MTKFKPHINVEYPPDNKLIFEEWFAQNYLSCNTDRELLPFFPTSYWVNNNYGKDKLAYSQVVYYMDSLDKSKNYFVICQYDDGCMINFKNFGLDVLEFNMSKTNGIMMPLLCMSHPYKFNSEKKWLANFVGVKTHPVREHANQLKSNKEYYISFERHNIENYCRIIHESIFTLCYRGYGINSFRIAEALQFGSIPVYISDDFIYPYDLDFNDFGVVINSRQVNFIDSILQEILPHEIIIKQDKLKNIYDNYYTYQANFKHIINCLETEYNLRQQARTVAATA